MKFSQFLELKYIEYQRNAGGRKTVQDFAGFLGIAQTTASAYMNGKRVPEGETVYKLAMKLGIEIYDSLGLPRPDPDLLYIQMTWGELSEDTRRKLRDLAEDAKQRNLNAAQPTTRKRKPEAAN